MSLIPVYLGLGSNVERERHLHAGLDALAGFLHDLRCSPVFESEPVGIKSGPFFNLVVSARTDLPLAELSLRLKHIEADNGRYAPERKGLPLDIDVLFYGDLV
ncbi:2-amino-4-hydroxy-6-hydroxymethyldihydropteridine diphosphokinase, partial [Pseudomonas aeruginosa]